MRHSLMAGAALSCLLAAPSYAQAQHVPVPLDTNGNPVPISQSPPYTVWTPAEWAQAFAASISVKQGSGIQTSLSLPIIVGGTIDSTVIGGATPAQGIFTSVLGDMSLGTALPTGATTARSLAARLGDAVNPRDYGAKCDGSTDDAASFQAAVNAAVSALRANGGKITVPAGICVIKSTVTATVPAGKSIGFVGDGASLTEFKVAAGVDGLIFNLGVGSGAAIGSFTVDRTGSSVTGNTGLAINATGSSTGTVALSHVATTSDNYPGSWTNGIVLTSIDTPSVDDIHTVSGFPPGDMSNGLTIKGLAGNYAIDSHLSHIWTQGGNIGLLISGYVQGVYVTDITSIAGNYGTSWTDGAANPQYVAELFFMSNAHLNAIKEDVQVAAVSINLDNGLLWRWTDGQGDSTPWTGIDLNNAGASTISNINANGGNGGSFTGSEYFIHLTNSSAVTIHGNTVLTINGPWLENDGGGVANIASGNVANGVGALVDNSGGSNSWGPNWVDGSADFSTAGGLAAINGGLAIAGNSSEPTPARLALPGDYMGWNYVAGFGNTDFFNSPGNGRLGGFDWFVFPYGASSPTKVATMSALGDIIAGGLDGTPIGQTTPAAATFAAANASSFSTTGNYSVTGGAGDGFIDTGTHSGASINLTGTTNGAEAISMSAATGGDGALIWYTGANELTANRWGLFYTDQTNALFHQSFPGMSFDIGGTTGEEKISSTGVSILGNLTAGTFYSGKSTRLSDVNVPVQIDSTTVGQAFFGANKAGGYGLLFGYTGNFGQIRQVTTDPLQILVNSTAVAAQFNSNLSSSFYGPVTLAAGSIDSSIASTGTLASGGSNNPVTNQNGVILYCSGTLASYSYTLPYNATNGQVFHLVSYCTITALTLNVQSGSYLSGSPGTISPTTPLAFVYDAAHATWMQYH